MEKAPLHHHRGTFTSQELHFRSLLRQTLLSEEEAKEKSQKVIEAEEDCFKMLSFFFAPSKLPPPPSVFFIQLGCGVCARALPSNDREEEQ